MLWFYLLERKARKYKRRAEFHYKMKKCHEKLAKRNWALYRQSAFWLDDSFRRPLTSSANLSQRPTPTHRQTQGRQQKRDVPVVESRGATPNGVASHHDR